MVNVRYYWQASTRIDGGEDAIANASSFTVMDKKRIAYKEPHRGSYFNSKEFPDWVKGDFCTYEGRHFSNKLPYLYQQKTIDVKHGDEPQEYRVSSQIYLTHEISVTRL